MLSRGPLPCIEQMNHKYNIFLESCTSFASLKRFMEELNLSSIIIYILHYNIKYNIYSVLNYIIR